MQRGGEGDQKLGFMSIVPIGLGPGRIRGQVGDRQLQADDWLPTQGKQGCRPICIPGSQIPVTLNLSTFPCLSSLASSPPGACCLPHSLVSPPTGSPTSPCPPFKPQVFPHSREQAREPGDAVPVQAPLLTHSGQVT